ncbi:MAG TPA: nicotinate (nicotinamide) nucleotide adenylyltransferase [Cyanobacteria bacterium UBA9971]|nr:nicotinate (nicotinamide) nucleotide adenylyltransferase [Cyanobacteria bacterium UBA9971]
MLNLTVFAGTFNPIHIAHLIIAESVRAELNAEKILFIPSFSPPHRENDIATPEHRLNMVKLAIKNNPHFEVSDIELKLQGTSYSYNTIQELYRQNPQLEEKINFIIGADAFNHIESWYKHEELAQLINFIVLARPKSKEVEEIVSNLSLKDFSYRFVEAPRIDISSSYIRQRIKEKKSIKYLVTNEVENYIIENKLYLN